MTSGPGRDFGRLLPGTSTCAVRGILVRCVFQEDFDGNIPRSYLYSSRAENRLNPRGTRALYFSESEVTAIQEHRRNWGGTPREHDPRILFSARVQIKKALDLSDGPTLGHFHLTANDLQVNWIKALQPTPLQQLGQAVATQKGIAAIRYVSLAAKGAGKRGRNVAIFPDALQTPDRVEIIGRGGQVIESWP